MNETPGHDPSTSPFLHSEVEAVSRVIAALGREHTFETGEYVYRQGEATAQFHQVVSGRVRIFFTLPDGSERVLSYAEEGASFGESGCFDGLPRYASSTASEPSLVLTIQRQDVLDAAVDEPAIMVEIARRLAHKQRVLSLHIVTDGLPARARVALLLLHLVQAYGIVTSGGGIRLAARHRLDELALLVGVTRVTFSRELSRLIAEGTIFKDGRDIVVSSGTELEDIVSEHLR